MHLKYLGLFRGLEKMKHKNTGFLLLRSFLAIAVVATVLAALFTHTAKSSVFNSVTLNFVTYNVCALPDMITAERNLAPVRERMPKIGVRLQGYDIVALQEVFVTERSYLERKMRAYYVARGTDGGGMRAPGSGIYTFAHAPIPRVHFERWDGLVIADAYSHKGFVAATVNIGDGLDIDVYNLHAQAGGFPELRKKNYEQMAEYMKRNSFGSGRPIVALGDFNCEIGEPECKRLLEITGLKHVNPQPYGIDHIFYNENGSNWKISVVSFGTVFADKVDGRTLSDHDGFEAKLKFDRE